MKNTQIIDLKSRRYLQEALELSFQNLEYFLYLSVLLLSKSKKLGTIGNDELIGSMLNGRQVLRKSKKKLIFHEYMIAKTYNDTIKAKLKKPADASKIKIIMSFTLKYMIVADLNSIMIRLNEALNIDKNAGNSEMIEYILEEVPFGKIFEAKKDQDGDKLLDAVSSVFQEIDEIISEA